MKSEKSYWVITAQNGLLGGAISLLLCLIGMVLTFNSSYIVGGIFTMGQVLAIARKLPLGAESPLEKYI
jgi:hypothetical protein